jgi:hypothetical protein
MRREGAGVRNDRLSEGHQCERQLCIACTYELWKSYVDLGTLIRR